MTDNKDDFTAGRPLAARKVRHFEGAKRIGAPGEPRAAREERSAAPPPQAPKREEHGVRMVEVGDKDVVHREAVAEGFLRLREATVTALREGGLKKGDPVPVAKVAAIMAAKNTPQFVPLCHPLPVTGVDVDLTLERRGVHARVRVRSDGKTGVEMEALTAVTAALLTVWDMTKYLEKDADGQYPDTRLEEVRVVQKVKGRP